MSYQREMFLSLLESIDGLLDDYGLVEASDQFPRWIGQVRVALKGAALDNKVDIWDEARQQVRFSELEPSMMVQMLNMRAVLLGIYGELFPAETTDELFPAELVSEERKYIQETVKQVNGCYQMGWYDACLVMVRRLIETLIIECFERHNVASRIKDSNGDYLRLAGLISAFGNNPPWHVPRYLPGQLQDLKDIGDWSAHSRHWTAMRGDVDKNQKAVRAAVQALIDIAQQGRN